MLCIDDLRPELLSFGVDYIRSPNIDRLAAEGRIFTRHYVQAPTCGASRYALLTGRYSSHGKSRGNNALVARAKTKNGVQTTPSLPEVFRAAGYTTVAVGKVSHHPGGLYGTDWNDPAAVEMPGAWNRQSMPTGAWKHPRGTMHGLAHGHVRTHGVTPAMESFDGPDEAYPDGLIAKRALEELESLARARDPFFLAVGLIRPHLPFGAPAAYMEPYAHIELPPIPHPRKPAGKTTWHGSGEFFGQYAHHGKDPRADTEYATALRKHYAACVSYVDALVGRLLQRLAELGLDDNTIVVLWGDHGWHLGEHGVWGKHTLFEESLRSPLILRLPGLARRGVASKAVVETVDLFPTLCAAAGLLPPERLDGRSLMPQLEDPTAPGRPAIAYKSNVETIRTERYRLIRHLHQGETSHLELYDHASAEGETKNLAEEEPLLARSLLKALQARLR